jgi:hypothetical protein
VRSNLDGSGLDTVLTDLDALFFVVCEDLEQIFWTEAGKICTATLFTDEKTDLVTGLGNPTGIALYYNAVAAALEQRDTPVTSAYLHQNYPNPFNPATTIAFQLVDLGYTTLKIYNVLGGEVTTLLSRSLPPGLHSYRFNAGDLASGVYYYELITKNTRMVKKMLLLR